MNGDLLLNSPSKTRLSYEAFDASLWFPVKKVCKQFKVGSNQLEDFKTIIKDDEELPLENTDLLKKQSVAESTTSPTNDSCHVLEEYTFYVFDTRKYSISNDNTANKTSWNTLQRDLKVHAEKTFSEFIFDSKRDWGSKTKKTTSICEHKKCFMRCKYAYIKNRLNYQMKRHTNSTSSENYKMSSTNGGRKLHSQKKGHQGCYRRSSSAFRLDNICDCAPFTIFNNDHCFFMISPKLQHKHTNHPKTIDFSGSSNLSKEIAKSREVMGYATKSSASQATGVKSLHNISKTRQAMKNAGKKDRAVCFDCNINQKELQQIHTVEELLPLFKYHNCRLLHLQFVQEKDSNGKWTKREVIGSLNDQDKNLSTLSENNYQESNDEIASWINETNPGNNLSSKESNTEMVKKEDLICIAWMNIEMGLLAKANPYSIGIDCTHKIVNIDNLSHLTVTTKDALGNTVVILRMWVPNQKQWMFRFVLRVVIPEMIGKDYCEKVNTIITDGDQQLIQIVDESKKYLYKNACRKRCSWHVIDRLYHSKYKCQVACKGKHFKNKYLKEWFIRVLQYWMYCWHKPTGGYYTMEDVTVSKAILRKFLNSDDLKEVFPRSSIQSLIEYFNDVVGNEKDTAFYNFLDVFDLEVYSNSAHEGTNSGIKNCSDGVTPTGSLGTSTQKIASHDNLRFTERNKTVTMGYRNKEKLDEFDECTRSTSGILREQMHATSLVTACSFHSESNTFYVVRPNNIHTNEDTRKERFKKRRKTTSSNESSNSTTTVRSKKSLENKKLSLWKTKELEEKLHSSNDDISQHTTKLKNKFCVPVIYSAFKVKLSYDDNDQSWYLNCSCCFGKRFGGPCVDEFFVYNNYLKHCRVKKFNHHQVSCVHWSMYSYLMSRYKTEDVEDMNCLEKQNLKFFRQYNPNERKGTILIFDENELSDNGDTIQQKLPYYIIEQQRDFVDENGDSAISWDSKNVCKRIMNYDESFVKECMKQYSDSFEATVNSSKYKVTLSQSQDPGWVVYDDNNDEDVNGNNEIFHDIIDGNTNNTAAIEANLRKSFYEVFNMYDMADGNNFSIASKAIADMKIKLREEYIANYGDDNLIRKSSGTSFPNRKTGNNRKDMITRR